MEHNPKDYTHEDWYTWYVPEEFGAELFNKNLLRKNTPNEKIIKAVKRLPEDYPYCVEHVVARECQPSMAWNPLYKGHPSN